MIGEMRLKNPGYAYNPTRAVVCCRGCGRDTTGRRGYCRSCYPHSHITYNVFRGVLKKNRQWRECADCGWVQYYRLDEIHPTRSLRCGNCNSTLMEPTNKREWGMP